MGDASVAIASGEEAVGIQGMGGIGKSVLAAAIARDPEVRQAFPGGVYWLTIGQKPDLPMLSGCGVLRSFLPRASLAKSISAAVRF